MVQWVKNPPAGDTGDAGSIYESGRSPGGGNGKPFQYSCLGNRMNREPWQATVHAVAESWTWLSSKASTSLSLKRKYKILYNHAGLGLIFESLASFPK